MNKSTSKMNVLFLMFAFYDMNKSFNMFTSIVNEFSRNGHNVFVIAPGTDKQKTHISVEKGIEILRVKTLPIKNVNIYIKGLSNILLPFQYKNAANKVFPHVCFDLIFIPTPPITLVDLAFSLKKKHKAKVYLLLRDIFPQNAVDLGFMKENSIIHTYFRRKEKKLYRISDLIGCMSQANIDFVLRNNNEVRKQKLHILRNFQYVYQGFGHDIKNLRKKFKLENKYVVIFGGNMGKAQQLSNILELAKRCLEYNDVVFLLLGEGVKMKRVSQKINELNITNINIHSKIPKKEYQDLLTICDVGLISLHENFTVPNIPSKSLDYWNVGLPILASVDRFTDYPAVLEKTNSGLWSYAGDHNMLKNNFHKLYKDKKLRKALGGNGQKYHHQELTPELAYKSIVKHLKSCFDIL